MAGGAAAACGGAARPAAEGDDTARGSVKGLSKKVERQSKDPCATGWAWSRPPAWVGHCTHRRSPCGHDLRTNSFTPSGRRVESLAQRADHPCKGAIIRRNNNTNKAAATIYEHHTIPCHIRGLFCACDITHNTCNKLRFRGKGRGGGRMQMILGRIKISGGIWFCIGLYSWLEIDFETEDY